VPDLDAGQRSVSVRAGHGDQGIDRGRREVGEQCAVALGGHRLIRVHVELLERGGGDHREGVEFRAEPAQRPDQRGAKATKAASGDRAWHRYAM
jgi:hypothetical protein